MSPMRSIWILCSYGHAASGTTHISRRQESTTIRTRWRTGCARLTIIVKRPAIARQGSTFLYELGGAIEKIIRRHGIVTLRRISKIG